MFTKEGSLVLKGVADRGAGGRGLLASGIERLLLGLVGGARLRVDTTRLVLGVLLAHDRW